jgi:tRNA nucleotidyltransferase (CCA-adding enzyme)
VLRACDPASFGEDPLRAIRVAQFAARFEMEPDAELLWICTNQDLSELSGERIFDELEKMLLQGAGFDRPRVCSRHGLIRFFPELEAIIDVPQDPAWHPEGDVWVHTLMVVDEAARLRTGEDEAADLALMFGALCHDLGKPETTFRDEDGRVRSPAHDVCGVAHTETMLARLRASHELSRAVCALVEHHLTPMAFVKHGARPKAYRRLARKLDAAGVDIELLVRVATADHFGRTTPEALARSFPESAEFLAQARALQLEHEGPKDVVLGRHLLARGLRPGPAFGPLLARCRELQDETGWTRPDEILDVVLREEDPADASEEVRG